MKTAAIVGALLFIGLVAVTAIGTIEYREYSTQSVSSDFGKIVITLRGHEDEQRNWPLPLNVIGSPYQAWIAFTSPTVSSGHIELHSVFVVDRTTEQKQEISVIIASSPQIKKVEGSEAYRASIMLGGLQLLNGDYELTGVLTLVQDGNRRDISFSAPLRVAVKQEHRFIWWDKLASV